MKTTIVLALTLTAASAFAQQPAAPPAAPSMQVDARFSAWLGCWRLDDDLSGTGARMCITPEKNGVRLQTLVGAQKGIDEVVIADGAAHSIADADCKGTERAEFSSDGGRLFRTTEVTCGKDEPRTIKAVIFMAPGPAWINVQHVSGEASNINVRVQRYRRSANQLLANGTRAQQPDAQSAARTSADSTRWSIDDVIEANGKLPAEALQAALTEVRHKFDLNRKTLVTLDDAGVHEQVVDLMVALTYPEKFVVQRAGGSSAPSGVLTGGGWFDPLMTPMLMGGMADCFSPLGYGYRSYYSMCGSALYGYGLYDSYYGYYGPRQYGSYGWVHVGAAPGGGIGSVEPQAEGRVVAGRGFTQIRSRDAEPSPRINGGSNGAAWSGASSGGGASSGNGFSGSSSGGSSGGGSSSGGDSGARVAVPKGGGQ
jgi:hypothetical protein